MGLRWRSIELNTNMEIVRKTFEKLMVSNTIEEVNQIRNDLQISAKYRMDDATYPPIESRITKEEFREFHPIDEQT